MKTKLLMTLSLTGLLGMSAISHAGGIKYGATYNVGDPIPNGDCMEMMCEHGCVEEDGSFIGHCCPSSGADGESCNTDGISIDACCNSSFCIDGKCGCKKNSDCDEDLLCDKDNHTCICPKETILYTKTDNSLGCCNTNTHKLNDIENSKKKACCPIETPFWDAKRQKCVECLTDGDCVAPKICQSGTCVCPPEKPFWNATLKECVRCPYAEGDIVFEKTKTGSYTFNFSCDGMYLIKLRGACGGSWAASHNGGTNVGTTATGGAGGGFQMQKLYRKGENISLTLGEGGRAGGSEDRYGTAGAGTDTSIEGMVVCTSGQGGKVTAQNSGNGGAGGTCNVLAGKGTVYSGGKGSIGQGRHSKRYVIVPGGTSQIKNCSSSKAGWCGECYGRKGEDGYISIQYLGEE